MRKSREILLDYFMSSKRVSPDNREAAQKRLLNFRDKTHLVRAEIVGKSGQIFLISKDTKIESGVNTFRFGELPKGEIFACDKITVAQALAPTADNETPLTAGHYSPDGSLFAVGLDSADVIVRQNNKELFNQPVKVCAPSAKGELAHGYANGFDLQNVLLLEDQSEIEIGLDIHTAVTSANNDVFVEIMLQGTQTMK
ncbi:MAG: hypothetical protein AAF363_15720 [Bacteroidota bacterium]